MRGDDEFLALLGKVTALNRAIEDFAARYPSDETFSGTIEDICEGLWDAQHRGWLAGQKRMWLELQKSQNTGDVVQLP